MSDTVYPAVYLIRVPLVTTEERLKLQLEEFLTKHLVGLEWGEIFREKTGLNVKIIRPESADTGFAVVSGCKVPFLKIRRSFAGQYFIASDKRLSPVVIFGKDFEIKRDPQTAFMAFVDSKLHESFKTSHGDVPQIQIFNEERLKSMFSINMDTISKRVRLKYDKPNGPPIVDWPSVLGQNVIERYGLVDVFFEFRINALDYMISCDQRFDHLTHKERGRDVIFFVNNPQKVSLSHTALLLDTRVLMADHKFIPFEALNQTLMSQVKLRDYNRVPTICMDCHKPYKRLGIHPDLGWIAARCECPPTMRANAWKEETFTRLTEHSEYKKLWNKHGSKIKPFDEPLIPLIEGVKPLYEDPAEFRRTAVNAANFEIKHNRRDLDRNHRRLAVVVSSRFIQRGLKKGKVRDFIRLTLRLDRKKGHWTPEGQFGISQVRIITKGFERNENPIPLYSYDHDYYSTSYRSKLLGIFPSGNFYQVQLRACVPQDFTFTQGQEVKLVPIPPSSEIQALKKAAMLWNEYYLMSSISVIPLEGILHVFQLLESSKTWSNPSVPVDIFKCKFFVNINAEHYLYDFNLHTRDYYIAANVLLKQSCTRVKQLYHQDASFSIDAKRSDHHSAPDEYVSDDDEESIYTHQCTTAHKAELACAPVPFTVRFIKLTHGQGDVYEEYPSELIGYAAIPHPYQPRQGPCTLSPWSICIGQIAPSYKDKTNISNQWRFYETIIDENNPEIPDEDELEEHSGSEDEDDGDGGHGQGMYASKMEGSSRDTDIFFDPYPYRDYERALSLKYDDVISTWMDRPMTLDMSLLNFLLRSTGTRPELLLEHYTTPLPNANYYVRSKIQRKMNPSQFTGIMKMMNNRITFVQGPPGTGKTQLAANGCAYLSATEDGIIVVACPSNYATHLFYERLLRISEDLPHYMKVIRMFSKSRERAHKQTDRINPHTGQILHDSVSNHPIWTNGTRAERLMNELRNSGLKRRKQKHFDRVERMLEMELLKTADIVVCTVGTSTDSRLLSLKKILMKTGRVFSAIVIDEGSVMTSPALIPVLGLNPARAWFLGDHLQLPPTVANETAKNAALDCSLLHIIHSLDHFHNDENFTLLDLQYRMADPLASIVSQFSYEGKVMSHSSVIQRNYEEIFSDSLRNQFPWMNEHNVCKYTYSEISEVYEKPSYYNRKEIQIVKKILEKMLAAGEDLSKVTVISMYESQRKILHTELQALGSRFKDVISATVDSFQGKENDFVIVSMVRSNAKHDIGFIRDKRRLNVAISRARHGLFFICHLPTFQNCKIPDMDKLMNLMTRYGTEVKC